jgi:ubiquinone/menaquinone biosynthesis C-methylase UbiE
MQFMDRVVFGDSRLWACSRASGAVLEVAVGTGLNIDKYPNNVRLTGLDFSERMLAVAHARACEVGREIDLRQGDAQALPFDDESFDTVVCTFGLCSISNVDTALVEMTRVLRPGGTLILVDHVASSSRIIRAIQRTLETFSVPIAGEHFLRRPVLELQQLPYTVEQSERFNSGIVERVVLRKEADT